MAGSEDLFLGRVEREAYLAEHRADVEAHDRRRSALLSTLIESGIAERLPRGYVLISREGRRELRRLRGWTSRLRDGARSRCAQLVLDESELFGKVRFSVIESDIEALEQGQPQEVRALQTFRGGAGGAMEFGADGRADVTLGPDTDLATIVSMGAIMTLRSLTPTELRDVEVAFGVKEGVWTAQDELRFARAYVRYVAEGHAPSPELEGAFEHVSAEATEDILDIELTDEMRRLFARFLT